MIPRERAIDVRAKACESVEDKLTAYLDGELEGDRATLVRGHLRTCTSCRELAAEVRGDLVAHALAVHSRPP